MYTRASRKSIMPKLRYKLLKSVVTKLRSGEIFKTTYLGTSPLPPPPTPPPLPLPLKIQPSVSRPYSVLYRRFCDNGKAKTKRKIKKESVYVIIIIFFIKKNVRVNSCLFKTKNKQIIKLICVYVF